MANIKISELNELYPAQKDYGDYLPIVDTSADETKKISVKNLTANGVQLIAVTDTAPEEYETGDKYYNTTNNKIYTATSSGWANPETPIKNIFYIILETQNIYTYDSDNETLVSVGGGAGGGDSAPIGQVSMYAGSTAPDGFLMCDGSAVSRETYKDLYRVIGTTYGTGDGSTTFNLPNIKGKVVVMLDTNDTDFDTLGETGGSKYLQEHEHDGLRWGLISGTKFVYTSQSGSTTAFDLADPGVKTVQIDESSTANIITESAGTGNSGNLQPYIVLNYIIKATKVTPTQAQVVNTFSDSTQDTYSCDYENKYFSGIVLYNNTSGAVTDITLSDSLANYTKIDIYFSKNNDTQTVATIWSPNGKNATLYCYNLYSNTDMQELFKFISMSGTSITSSYGAYRNASSTDTYGLVSENQVKIYKVIGYK